MQRRDLFTICGAALALSGTRALAQTATAATDAKFVRIYATPDGGSRLEELTISPDAKPIDITRMTAGAYRGSGARAPDWRPGVDQCFRPRPEASVANVAPRLTVR